MKTREQKSKINYKENSSSSESDSDHDHDCKRRRRSSTSSSTSKRRSRKNSNANSANNNNKLLQVGSSSRSSNVTVLVPRTRHARGRPLIIDMLASVEEKDALKRRRQTLLYQMPKASNNEEIKMKTSTIVSWMIDMGLISEDARVEYLNGGGETQKLAGTIKRGGVLCDCCGTVITVYKFEEHANGVDLKQPYANICLVDSGVSLMSLINCEGFKRPEQLARCGSHLVDETQNINDDACMICSEGGHNLICCKKCPSTFHQNCMSLKNKPQGERLCPLCICKFCGASNPGELHECGQCERRYHLNCVNSLRQPFCPDSPTQFCGKSCEEVFSKMGKLLGVRNELGEGFTWSIVRMMLDRKPENSEDLHKSTVCNSKVAVAWTVMDEIFLPNFDRRTGINIIQSIVYNRECNLRRLNFRNFYTAILERNDEFVCVASIRVHGTKIAEIPFVGTREKFRSGDYKGIMMPKLFTQIESALGQLTVENLVIPSVPQLVQLWIQKYGFSRNIKNTLEKDLINYNTFMFPHAVRLHKSVVPTAVATATAAVKEGEANNSGTGLIRGECYAKVAFFDLNLEPPEEEDDAAA